MIAELLNLGSDAVYRRIRGEKELSLSETTKICTHFQISMDEILNHKSNGITFRYSTLDFVNDPRHYHRYIDQFAKNIELSAKAEDKEILFTAEDIPVFHFMPYPELIFFKLYAAVDDIGPSSVHFQDLIALTPTDGELIEASHWVGEQDPSPAIAAAPTGRCGRGAPGAARPAGRHQADRGVRRAVRAGARLRV